MSVCLTRIRVLMDFTMHILYDLCSWMMQCKLWLASPTAQKGGLPTPLVTTKGQKVDPSRCKDANSKDTKTPFLGGPADCLNTKKDFCAPLLHTEVSSTLATNITVCLMFTHILFRTIYCLTFNKFFFKSKVYHFKILWVRNWYIRNIYQLKTIYYT